MKVTKWARESMLETLRSKLAFSYDPNGKVEFYTSADDLICELEFNQTELNTIGDNAILILKSIDGSKTLRGFSLMEGTPSTFKILGRQSGPESDEYVITGTVGNFSSKSDLKFNTTSWKLNTYITIKDFGIELQNGL